MILSDIQVLLNNGNNKGPIRDLILGYGFSYIDVCTYSSPSGYTVNYTYISGKRRLLRSYYR